MSGFTHKFTSGENKQKNRQDILNMFNRMTIDTSIETIKKYDAEASELVWILRRLVCNSSGMSPYAQLQGFKKYVPKLIDTIFFHEAVADYSFEQIDRLMNGIDVNKNKKWEKEDEEALIEMVCKDINDVEIAVKFGRSVPAIKTKVSQLVGIGRIDQKIAGRFIGRVNGVETDAMLDGIVYKSKN